MVLSSVLLPSRCTPEPERSLRAGSSIVKRAPRVGAAAVPFGGRPHDREAEPGARPVGAAPPEALEGELRLLGRRPGTLVGDAERDAVPRLPHRRPTIRPSAGPCTRAFCDEVVERALERVARRPARDRRGASTTSTRSSPRDARREQVEPHDAARQARRFLAREREQIVGEVARAARRPARDPRAPRVSTP